MLINYIAQFSDNTYGAKRIKKVLNTLNFPVSPRKMGQLINDAHVCVCYKNKYKAATNSAHNKPIYQNELKKNFLLKLQIKRG
jgi:hypothetical protein